MTYQELIDCQREERIKALKTLISYNTERAQAIETKEEVYPFGKEVQRCFEEILRMGQDMGFAVKNVDNYGGHIDFEAATTNAAASSAAASNAVASNENASSAAASKTGTADAGSSGAGLSNAATSNENASNAVASKTGTADAGSSGAGLSNAAASNENASNAAASKTGTADAGSSGAGLSNAAASKIFGILGHLDVVPAAGGWSVEPYAGEIKDGYIYGRGTTDDKGPMVACLYAMKALKDSGYAPKHTIRLLIGLDEETGWDGMARYLSKENPPDFGFTPDADFPLINGEMGMLVFNLARKFNTSINSNGLELRQLKGGMAANSVADSCRAVLRSKEDGAYDKIRQLLTEYKEETSYKLSAKGLGKSLEIISTGKAAHGAKPASGLNAISIMMDFLSRLNFVSEEINDFIAFYQKHIGFELDGQSLGIGLEDEPSGKLILNVGMIELDDKMGKLTINVRYPVTLREQDVFQNLKPVLERYDLGLIKVKHHEPVFMDLENPMVKDLLEIYQNHTGDTASKPLVIGGGTYARACKNVIAYGALFPGDEDLMHQKDERLSLERFDQMTKIYADAIYKLSSAEYNI